MLSSAVSYVVVSLITGPGRAFNMDYLLHRGKYARELETKADILPATGWRVFKMSKEFTFGDKCIFSGSYGYIVLFFGIFLVGTLYALNSDIADTSWMSFWRGYCWVMLLLSVVITLWLAIGGGRDLKSMLQLLRTTKRDTRDDGTVVGHRNLDELD